MSSLRNNSARLAGRADDGIQEFYERATSCATRCFGGKHLDSAHPRGRETAAPAVAVAPAAAVAPAQVPLLASVPPPPQRALVENALGPQHATRPWHRAGQWSGRAALRR